MIMNLGVWVSILPLVFLIGTAPEQEPPPSGIAARAETGSRGHGVTRRPPPSLTPSSLLLQRQRILQDLLVDEELELVRGAAAGDLVVLAEVVLVHAKHDPVSLRVGDLVDVPDVQLRLPHVGLLVVFDADGDERAVHGGVAPADLEHLDVRACVRIAAPVHGLHGFEDGQLLAVRGRQPLHRQGRPRRQRQQHAQQPQRTGYNQALALHGVLLVRRGPPAAAHGALRPHMPIPDSRPLEQPFGGG